MEIYKTDYITIDLVKTGAWEKEGNVGGPMYGLVITIQCNGKLKRHTTNFEVNHQEVKHWRGIHTVIELLNDLGYSMDVKEIQSIIEEEIYDID